MALPDAKQPRGTAATLMVEKFAGRLAEEGKSLEEIFTKTTEYER